MAMAGYPKESLTAQADISATWTEMAMVILILQKRLKAHRRVAGQAVVNQELGLHLEVGLIEQEGIAPVPLLSSFEQPFLQGQCNF